MDLMAVDLPAVVQWPSYTDATAFVDIYDWDIVKLDLLESGYHNALIFHLDLCSGIFPCYLELCATQQSAIHRSAFGSLSCSASLGCSGVSLTSVHFLCNSEISPFPVVEMAGTKLVVANATFDGCASENDGGAIQAYGGSVVNISGSAFRNCKSASFGGAISMVGGYLQVMNTSFEHCSSVAGGGAVSTAEYSCYGARTTVNTTVDVVGCRFARCHSEGNGGGLLLSASQGTVAASQFFACQSMLSGGAVSAGAQSRLHVQNSELQGNAAQGVGGGALHAHGQTLTFSALACRDNSALNGGGGALFWEADLISGGGTSNDASRNTSLANLTSQSSALGCSADSGNQAAYGPCVATSFIALEVVGLPTLDTPAFAGLPFAVTVVKRDGFNQTVVSDSSSLVKAESVVNTSSLEVRHVVSLGVSEVVSGIAYMSLTLRPTFAWRGGMAEIVEPLSILFSGTDAQTGGVMQASGSVAFASGSAVCPTGYVLLLNSVALAGESVPGYCSQCGPGTYSVSPLAGPKPSSLPACLDCLAGATCAGGSSITLPVGYWAVHDGSYQLVGCPAGHQLVNSVAGVFSYAAQACVACAADEYIINPNSSLIACQACPTGAICNGAILQSRVAGALWVANAKTGLYTLKSCPPGYEKVGLPGGSEQDCQTCPAAYFCVGGAAPGDPCPDGSFSTPGANSSGACIPAIFVDVKATLPLAQADFGPAAQGLFAEALADTCGVLPTQILIWSVEALRRMAESATILVEARIATPDNDVAAAIVSRVETALLSVQLARQGLPPAVIESVFAITAPAAAGSLSEGALVGLAGLVVIVLLLVAILARSITHKPVMDEEAQQEAARIQALRQRLGITPADGFVLGAERVPMLRARGLVVVQIRRSHVEAAARLGAGQEFDIDQFDALCVLLRQQSGSSEPNRQYAALCEWLLEVSEGLIRPDIEEIQEGSQPQFKVVMRSSAAQTGFDFFRRRYCRNYCL